MPLPAPSYFQVIRRAQGVVPPRSGNVVGDTILLECQAVTGASQYLISYSLLGTAYTFTSASNQFAIFRRDGGDLPAAFEGALASGSIITSLQVAAVSFGGVVGAYCQLSNGSADLNGASGGGASPGSLSVRSGLNPVNASFLEPPVPTAVMANGLTSVTVTFSYTPTAGYDHLLSAQITNSDGTGNLGSASVYAVLVRGTGCTLVVPCSLAYGTSYLVKMASLAHRTGTSATYTKSNTTTLPVTTTSFGITPSSQTVVAAQPFSISIAPAQADAPLTPVSFPERLYLSLKTGSAPQVLSGQLATPGLYHLQMVEAIGSDSQVLTFDLTVGAVLAVPEPIVGWQGDQLLDLVRYLGQGTVQTWFLTNGPPGVAIGTTGSVSGEYEGTPAPYVVAITGVPGAFGIYDAQVSALVLVNSVPYLYTENVRFEVSGGLFLSWFHDAPERRELQVLLRDRSVSGYLLPAAGLRLKRGDDERLYLIFRDGPLTAENLGREILSSDGFSELHLIVRPASDYDAEPYLDLAWPTTAESIAEHSIIYFDFNVTSLPIERAFKTLNLAAGADEAQSFLAAVGELTWVRNGRETSSETFPVQILQDVDR